MGSWTQKDQELFERIRDSGPTSAQADGAGPDDAEPRPGSGTFTSAGGDPVAVVKRILTSERMPSRIEADAASFQQHTRRGTSRPTAT